MWSRIQVDMSRRKTHLAGFTFVSGGITLSMQCTFFILFSSKFIHETLVSALPHFHLLILCLLCWVMRPLQGEIKQFQASVLLQDPLGFGSLQQIHKKRPDYNLKTTDSLLAIIFISLPMDQEWVLFLSGELTLSTHSKKGNKTIHVFFEIVTNDKTQ